MNGKVVKDNLNPKAYNTIYEAFSKTYGEENVLSCPGVSYKKEWIFL